MTTATKAPAKETWRDWLAEDGVDQSNLDAIEAEGLLTRDQVIAAVNDTDLVRHKVLQPVSVDDVELWEYRGILPRPIRRWHEGAVRALYPRWAINLVAQVRRYQYRGVPLDELAPRLRAFVRNLYSTHPLDVEIRENADNRGQTPEDLRLPDELQAGAIRLATWHRRITGVPTERVEIAVVDENGRRSTYAVQIAVPPPTEREIRMTQLGHHLDQLRTQIVSDSE